MPINRTLATVCVLLASAGLLGACASTAPTGPMVDAMPGPGKSPATFANDDRACQMSAQNAVGQTPGEAANNAAVGSAVAGTAIGAGAGALIGSAAGRVGSGAAIGAGTGLLAGSLIGANNARAAAGANQYSYDTVYANCMRARGNRIGGPPVAVVDPGYPPPPPPPYWGPPGPYYRPYGYW
jgi:YMGG-like Gly-zipper